MLLKGLTLLFEKEISTYQFDKNEIFFNEDKKGIKKDVFLKKLKDFFKKEGLSFFQKELYNGLWISEVRSSSGFVMFGARNKTQMESFIAISKKLV